MKAFTTAALLLASISGVLSEDVSGVQGANCQGFKITLENVEVAAEAALKLLSTGDQIGENKYPHEMENREGFDFLPDCDQPFYEFPIMKDGGAYDGGQPGKDRVIIGTVQNTTAVFGGVVTHDGGSAFVQCQLDGKNSTVLYGVVKLEAPRNSN